MTTITPRQLFDAAVKAGLAMPDAVTGEINGEPYVDFRACRSASLADVECAVMDALAEGRRFPVRNGDASCPYGAGWYILRMPAIWVSMPLIDSGRYDTRAAALLAACEALAKEGK